MNCPAALQRRLCPTNLTQRQRPQVWAATGERPEKILHWTGAAERVDVHTLRSLGSTSMGFGDSLIVGWLVGRENDHGLYSS